MRSELHRIIALGMSRSRLTCSSR